MSEAFLERDFKAYERHRQDDPPNLLPGLLQPMQYEPECLKCRR